MEDNFQISSPLEFLFAIYGSKHAAIPASFAKVSIARQLSLIEQKLSSSSPTLMHYSDPIEFAQSFVAEGITELDNPMHAFAFFSIFAQFNKEIRFCASNLKNVHFQQWSEFHLSRAVFLPFAKFKHIFTKYNGHHHNNGRNKNKKEMQLFLKFVFDLFCWISKHQYTFNALMSDYSQKCESDNKQFAALCISRVYPSRYAIGIDTKPDSASVSAPSHWIEFVCDWIPSEYWHYIENLFSLSRNSEWVLLARQQFEQTAVVGDDGNDAVAQPQTPVVWTEKYFASKTEYSKNVNNPNALLYSNLEINYNAFRDCNGRLSFLILWPNLHRNSDTYANSLNCEGMIWSQKSSPISSSSKVDGYQPIFVPYPGMKPNGMFHGLETSHENALLSGCSGSWWWYAIGTNTAHTSKIPGPIIYGTGIAVTHTELYIFDIHAAIRNVSQALIMDQCSSWMIMTVAVSIVEYMFDETYIIQRSLNRLYPTHQ